MTIEEMQHKLLSLTEDKVNLRRELEVYKKALKSAIKDQFCCVCMKQYCCKSYKCDAIDIYIRTKADCYLRKAREEENDSRKNE